MNGENLNVLATAVANAMGKNMSAQELALWGVFLSMVGDALGVLAAARSLPPD